MSKLRVFVASLCLSITLFCCGCSDSGKKDQGSRKPEDDTAPAKDQNIDAPATARKPDFSLTLDEFAKGFTTIADAEANAKKYEGKIIEITGPIDGVSTQFGPTNAVISSWGAKANKDDLGVLLTCRVAPKLRDKALRLSRGQEVKMTAAFQGARAKNVNLQIQGLEELSKSTLLLVNAADLAKEFVNNKEAAEKKYHDKVDVVVVGEVEDLAKKDNFEYAKLKGDGKVRISFTMQAGENEYMRKGQIVQLRSNLPAAPSFRNNEVLIDAGFVISAKQKQAERGAAADWPRE